MGIQINTGFEVGAGVPIDERMVLSKEQMLNTDDSVMPLIYMAVCSDDNSLYIYNKNNTSSLSTGKFRKYSTGEGGGSVDNEKLVIVGIIGFNEETHENIITSFTHDFNTIYQAILDGKVVELIIKPEDEEEDPNGGYILIPSSIMLTNITFYGSSCTNDSTMSFSVQLFADNTSTFFIYTDSNVKEDDKFVVTCNIAEDNTISGLSHNFNEIYSALLENKDVILVASAYSDDSSLLNKYTLVPSKFYYSNITFHTQFNVTGDSSIGITVTLYPNDTSDVTIMNLNTPDEKNWIDDSNTNTSFTWSSEKIFTEINNTASEIDEIQTALGNKVDKVSGKGLSTNDYTTTEKDKLAGIAEGANKTTVDTIMSASSTNPVQNKVVKTELDKKARYGNTTMVGLGVTANALSTIRDFWLKLNSKFGNHGTIYFTWKTAEQAYVGTSDSNKVLINGGTLVYTSSGAPGSWKDFSAIYIGGGGLSEVWYIKCSIGEDTTNGKETVSIARLTTATEVADAKNLANATGTLAVGKGGTGQTSAKNASNAFINALDTSTTTPNDADYFVSQYVGGGTTTTTYNRRPLSALWTWIKSKIEAIAFSIVTATKLRATSTNDLNLSSFDTDAIVTGSKTSFNIGMNANEIQARNNGAVSPLYINGIGGLVYINDSNANGGGLKVNKVLVIPSSRPVDSDISAHSSGLMWIE